MGTKLQAPEGKFRVVSVDLFEHEDYLVDDFDDYQKAFDVADNHNAARASSMSDVYYVYDDEGNYIRGEEAVGGEVSP